MRCKELTIRPSGPADETAIAVVQTEAFGRPYEARLALSLIHAPETTISIVAQCEGKIVGHILLSPVAAPVPSMALAPLAVLPEYREMQVGTALVRAALERAREMGTQAVFVLGDNLYYGRFGFSSELADPFEVGWQGRNFMALELEEGCLAGKHGRLEYPEAFFNT
jgi:putative acetyltransferase